MDNPDKRQDSQGLLPTKTISIEELDQLNEYQRNRKVKLTFKGSEIESHCKQSMIDSVMKSNILAYIHGFQGEGANILQDPLAKGYRKRSSSYGKQSNLKET